MNAHTSRNVQSPIQSAVFVGLRAENFHAIDMHATRFRDDRGADVFEMLYDAVKQISDLKGEIEGLKADNDIIKRALSDATLSGLKDVDVTDASEGDALVFADGKWKPAATSDAGDAPAGSDSVR